MRASSERVQAKMVQAAAVQSRVELRLILSGRRWTSRLYVRMSLMRR